MLGWTTNPLGGGRTAALDDVDSPVPPEPWLVGALPPHAASDAARGSRRRARVLRTKANDPTASAFDGRGYAYVVRRRRFSVKLTHYLCLQYALPTAPAAYRTCVRARVERH